MIALGVAPHPSRVGTLVALERALEVLDRRHRVDARVGDKGHERELLALELFLEDHTLLPGPLREEPLDVRRPFFDGGEVRSLDPHPFPGRDPVRLDDERLRELLEPARHVVPLLDGRVAGGRVDVVALQEIATEVLRALDPGPPAVRSDDRDPGGTQRVRDPRHERGLGSDDRVVDLGALRDPDNGVGLGRFHHVVCARKGR